MDRCSYLDWKHRNVSLVKAAEQGHEERIEILLRAGADVNACNKRGVTPC